MVLLIHRRLEHRSRLPHNTTQPQHKSCSDTLQHAATQSRCNGNKRCSTRRRARDQSVPNRPAIRHGKLLIMTGLHLSGLFDILLLTRRAKNRFFVRVAIGIVGAVTAALYRNLRRHRHWLPATADCRVRSPLSCLCIVTWCRRRQLICEWCFRCDLSMNWHQFNGAQIITYRFQYQAIAFINGQFIWCVHHC